MSSSSIIIAINIGYTMKPMGLQDLDTRENLYKYLHMKRNGFQGDLNPIDPQGFIV